MKRAPGAGALFLRVIFIPFPAFRFLNLDKIRLLLAKPWMDYKK